MVRLSDHPLDPPQATDPPDSYHCDVVVQMTCSVLVRSPELGEERAAMLASELLCIRRDLATSPLAAA